MRDNQDIKYDSNSLLSEEEAASLLGSAFHPLPKNKHSQTESPHIDSSGEDPGPVRPSSADPVPIPATSAPSSESQFVYPHRRPPPKRLSSLSLPSSNGLPKVPRTSNRVRFAEKLGFFPNPKPLWDADEEDHSGHANGKTIPLQSLQADGHMQSSPSLSPCSPMSPGDGRIRPKPVQRAWLERDDPLTRTSTDSDDDGAREGLLGGGDIRRSAAAHGLTVAAEVKSGLRDAFFNMANSIIGAGIIGQPYAFKQAGLLTGVILLVGLTITVDWTIRLIVLNSKLSGKHSFQTTVEHCFGKLGLVAISMAQWAFAFGGMVAFCVIVGDTIPHVLTAIWPGLPEMSWLWMLGDRRFVILILVGGISYPLSLYRDIAKLAKASTLALISMLVIIVTVLTQGAMVDQVDRGELSGYLFINSGVFQAIGVISFAFVCHHNSLLIYGSLHTPTLDRFAFVTHASTGVSMVACLTMALGGFLSFGSATLGNVLNNFPRDNIMVNVARFCFGLNMLTTLPLEAFVCREVMLNYFWPNEVHDDLTGEKFYTKRHVLLTTGLVGGAMGLSLTTCDLGAVFELIGATSACALAYILPPGCYLKLSTRRGMDTYLAWTCIVFGFAVMGISTVQTVVKMLSGESSTQQCS